MKINMNLKETNEKLRKIYALLDGVVNHRLPTKTHGAQSYVEHDIPQNPSNAEWSNLSHAKEDYANFKSDLLRIALRELNLLFDTWDEIYEMEYEEENHVCKLIDTTEEMVKEKFNDYLAQWWPSKVDKPPRFPVLWGEEE